MKLPYFGIFFVQHIYLGKSKTCFSMAFPNDKSCKLECWDEDTIALAYPQMVPPVLWWCRRNPNPPKTWYMEGKNVIKIYQNHFIVLSFLNFFSKSVLMGGMHSGCAVGGCLTDSPAWHCTALHCTVLCWLSLYSDLLKRHFYWNFLKFIQLILSPWHVSTDVLFRWCPCLY